MLHELGKKEKVEIENTLPEEVAVEPETVSTSK